MSFAAYTSAMVVRQGSMPEWQHFKLPPILYWNTLRAGGEQRRRSSSRASASAARSIGSGAAVSAQAATSARVAFWYRITLALGLRLSRGAVSRVAAALARRGVYLATSPSSSFFYVLTALHALHLLGGIGALVYALALPARGRWPAARERARARRRVYWHFMAVLWVYLLVVLALWV